MPTNTNTPIETRSESTSIHPSDAANSRILKVCIATPFTIGVSETFIQAIIDGLDGQPVHIQGHGLAYSCGGTSIAAESGVLDKWISRSLNLLPRFMEFRIRQRICDRKPHARVLADFLQANDVDVVLAQYGTQGADLLPACEIANIPLVAHFHGFDASRRSTLQTYKYSYEKLFNYCERLIAVSKRMKSDLIQLGCDERKISHLTYAPHTSFFDIYPNYESTNVVMVGRLTDQKAPHLSLLAFARASEQCPNLRLRVVGDGELLSVCRDLVNGLGISGKVDLLGAGDRLLVQREFSDASMFLQHSIEAANGDREGTPVAVLEAGASGLPVVSTLHAGIPDVVISGKTGILVEEGDVDAMTEAICTLANDSQLTASLGTSAKAHIKQNFTMERHLSNIRTVLQEAVHLHQQRSV